jgi:molybdenum cofactor synthesis domain-containing protein
VPAGDGQGGAHATGRRVRRPDPVEAAGTGGERAPERRRALVVTVSDGVAAGVRQDVSGDDLARRLDELGFGVDRAVVPDERARIEQLLVAAADGHAMILTAGGTGLTPRDVTPQATQAVIEYEVPGLPELMRAEGGRSTPYAYLSRAVAGVRQRCLIVNLPGSPRGALESLAALEPILDHALVTLAGPFDHDLAPDGDRTPAKASRTRAPHHQSS